MSERFEDLYNEEISKSNLKAGRIIKAKVVKISPDFVIVNTGLKSEGVIPTHEFGKDSGELGIQIGDEVEVALDSVEDGFGETIVSREKAKRQEAWRFLEEAFKSGDNVTGVIVDRVKGGFTVEVHNVRAFLPGSLVDVRPIRDPSSFEGKELDFKVIKLDHRRNNIVVSRRAVVQEGSSAERAAMIEKLQEGQEVKGIVKNLTDYGAFIDLGGVDGLLHITDMSWKRVKHPSELLNPGDEINVKILKFDRERQRVSLGIKQLGEDPWGDLISRYPIDTRLSGKVTNITDYGCFVELEDGVEGLVHMSEMDWTNKNIHPSKVVQLGQEINVLVLEIDTDRRRISLGMKQCAENPWEAFSNKYAKGDKVAGKIKSITDFGVFIGLEGNIDGLIHLSDVSWDLPPEEAVRDFKKGQDIEALILAVDPERERISLGIKQLNDDPFLSFISLNNKGSIVNGTILSIDLKAAVLELAEGVEGTLPASEYSAEKISDLRSVLKVGDTVESKIVQIDKRGRTIGLSVRAKDIQEEADALSHYRSQEEAEETAPTLGDLIKEKMDTSAKSEDE